MVRIYLDYAATTPVDPAVFAAMEPYFGKRFGNPGSLHAFGQEAIAAVDHAREAIARSIGTGFRNIIFTASATEANNLALRGAVFGWKRTHPGKASHIIISAIEHESILETARALEAEGVRVTYLPVNAQGIVDLKNIKEHLTSETAIVSIMYANNETGSVEPIQEIACMVKEFRGGNAYPLFHADAAQAFQFLETNVEKLGLDCMTLSSHKICGPKGAGALYIKDAPFLQPITTGGGQEFGMRPGTENVPAIAGFGKAVELADAARERECARIKSLRDLLCAEIQRIAPHAEANGGGEALPNILNMYFPGNDAQDLLTKFDLKGLAASSGSACRSRAVASSYVIEALGYSKERAKSSIRFSLGRPTTQEEVEEAVRIIKSTISPPSSY